MTAFLSETFVGRWKHMSLVEQLGNVGSEVERAFSMKRKGREDLASAAFDRSLDLIDLTLSDPRWKGRRLREVARLREFFCDMVLGENVYGMSEEFFSRYFLSFAYAARNEGRTRGEGEKK
jgi:hypothetical protein